MNGTFDINGNVINASVNPESYGAIGDGLTDDSDAIQEAVNNHYVLFGSNKTYKISKQIFIPKNSVVDLNGATVLSTGNNSFVNFEYGDNYGVYDGNGNITVKNGKILGGCISFIHGENLKFIGLDCFKATQAHFIQICACKNVLIDKCTFKGMLNLSGLALEYINIDTNASYGAFPYNDQSKTTFYDMTTNKTIVISNSRFEYGEEDYAYGFDAIGAHGRNVENTYTEDVTICNNCISGFSLCGLRLNAMDGVYVTNNYIETLGDGIRIGDVADAKNIIVVNNYVVSKSGEKLIRTSGSYTNLTVSGNITEGDTQDF